VTLNRSLFETVLRDLLLAGAYTRPLSSST
jgi:hypothetical protein